MELSFEEACRGVNKELTLRVLDTCGLCKGSKCASGHKPQVCKQCNGTGMESVQTGPFFMRTTCRVCYGRREVITHKCKECAGKGVTHQHRRVNIPVPAGVEDGQTMRMNIGKQEIFISFKIKPSEIFRRDKEDVHSDLAISISQAVLGGTVNVKGIYDDHVFRIPSGTQSHQRFRLTGKGIKRIHSSGYGDHYIYIKIKIPTYDSFTHKPFFRLLDFSLCISFFIIRKLTREQKALINTYAETDTDVNGTIDGITSTSSGTYALF